MKNKIYMVFFILGLLLLGSIVIAEIGLRNKDTTLELSNDNLTAIDGFKGFNKEEFESTLKNYYNCECLDYREKDCIAYGTCTCYVVSSWHHNVNVGRFVGNISESEWMDSECDDKTQSYLNNWLQVELGRMNPIPIEKVAEGDINLNE